MPHEKLPSLENWLRKHLREGTHTTDLQTLKRLAGFSKIRDSTFLSLLHAVMSAFVELEEIDTAVITYDVFHPEKATITYTK